MKIVHLAKNDIQGGAARSAYRLHEGLRLIGCDSSMVVASRASDDPNVTAFEKPMDPASVVLRGIRQIRIERDFAKYKTSRPSGFDLFSDDRSSYAATLLDQIPPCDVINLHWVSGFVDYEHFWGSIPQSTPVVWTFHDMNAFMGGCHYNLGCTHYLQHCAQCPQLGSSEEKDLSYKVWERKRKIFSRIHRSRLHIATPSKWLGEEAARSPILQKFPVSVIPYGLNLQDFAPRHKGNSRDFLGIPQDAKVVLFVAEGINMQRKGFALLAAALAQCVGTIDKLMLVSIGQNKPKLELAIPWVHVGSLNNDRFLSMVYSAADVFVIPSLQDNFPNTVLEAMACGIPVVGHSVGGIPDMVRNGVNGLTVATADVDALAKAISSVVNDSVRCTEMGANARRIAVQEYSLELQAQRYSDLYTTLV